MTTVRALRSSSEAIGQDWFTDHHIGADEKPFVPLIKSAKDPHHVLAVVGYCIDNSVKVTSRTKKIYRVRTLVEE